ncbi:multidrug efflux pump subunit AcrB [Bradyrhizobium sp. GM0.4]
MDRLVALAVNRRFLMVGMFVAVLIGGLIAFNQLNIEAYPDPTPPMVDIVTQSPGACRRRRSSATSRFRSRPRSRV